MPPGVVTQRLIPARAGNTHLGSLGFARQSAHPRSRGEHNAHEATAPTANGSSPLARGTQLFASRSIRLRRLIPARAGNTAASCQTTRRRAAHPRSRGEHCPRRWSRLVMEGSSPLARGTPASRARGIKIIRLIPARAGNTRYTGTGTPVLKAHPRSRGEHGCARWTQLLRLGSSPLARGTR